MSHQYVFVFNAVPSNNTKHRPITFQCNLKCTRCKGLTPRDGSSKQQQCTRTSCIGTPYCAEHMRSALNLCIRPSTIPGAGMGVFVCKSERSRAEFVFRKGRVVCDYGGEVVSEEELTRRYGDLTAPYGLAGDTDGYYEDAACLRGIGSMINHNAENTNVKYHHDLRSKKMVIVATQNIRDGEELFIDYGPDYVCNEHGASHATIAVGDAANASAQRSYIVGPLENLMLGKHTPKKSSTNKPHRNQCGVSKANTR